MIYLNCLYITIIVVLIIDIFRFWDTFSAMAIYYLTKKRIRKSVDLKPFSCALCMSWWLNLIYIIYSSAFSMSVILYILLLSFSTNIIGNVLLTIENFILTGINKINKLIEKYK